jgi:type I restriction enzyme R subunit
MQDHGLFQAICRVNRLDGDDKDYGYIVDYRDLFNSLETAITDYTSGALDGYEAKDIEGLLSNRIDRAREDLDEALEKIRALCEPVEPPKNTLQYQKYFCAADQGSAEQLKANEPKRVELYKTVAALVRNYGNLANEMSAAGYSDTEAVAIKAEVAHYANVRDEVKLGAGEDVDFKQYEAGMRHLLDTYIQAKPSETLSNFEDTGLIDLIVKLGAGALDKLPNGIRKDPEAVAETITNNMRKVIVDERPMNPKYYDRMSELLDALLEERRKGALDYKAYLEKLLEQASQLGNGEGTGVEYPGWADNGARRALYDFFDSDEESATAVDRAVRHSKPDSWVGNSLKEKKVKRAIQVVLPKDFEHLDELVDLVKARNEYQ